MHQALDFVTRHGAPVVFAIIFLDQLGVPLPSPPLLVAFGALAGSGRIDPVLSAVLAISASVCADYLWFLLGRWRGTRALALLCGIALEPDSCVSKTRDFFARHGVKSLLVAKFVPGLDTVAPPLAGLLGVGTSRFLVWSAGGAALWVGVFGGIGYVFSERFEELAESVDRIGSNLAWIAAVLLGLYLAWKYVGRRRVLRSIRTARITPEELHRLILSGIEPVIIDARNQSAFAALPVVIEGARLLALEEIDKRHSEIPRDREVIVYCS
jgi:membrane protein DedA with SNARE-associated domain